MRILFFDTETNGLPWNRHASYRNTENWPRVLQIAWQVWHVEGEVATCLHRMNAFVAPDASIKWDTGAAAIHKRTLAELQQMGKPMQTVLNWFVEDCKGVDLVVAHNLKFDKMALWAESVRAEMDPLTWWPPHELCTMNACVGICKIPGKKPTPQDPYKWPRLSEVFQFLFPHRDLPEDLHDAQTDVNCLVDSFRELVQLRLVCLPAL